MEGKRIEIQLHTPILLPGVQGEGVRPVLEAVIKVTGIISQFHEGGILLQVEDLITEKNQRLVPPHPQVFLPHHKIDHFFTLG